MEVVGIGVEEVEESLEGLHHPSSLQSSVNTHPLQHPYQHPHLHSQLQKRAS